MNFRCVICQKGMPYVSLFRINAKGQPGLWACAKHLKQTDAPPLDPELQKLSEILAGKQP